MFVKIRQDFDNARKTQNVNIKKVLESLIADIIYREKAVGKISDIDIIQCVERQIKIISEQIEYCKDVEQIRLYNEQKEYLKKYLPQQLTENEVRNMIKEIKESFINVLPANRMKGEIMKQLMPKISGQFDKSKVSHLVDEFISSIN